MGDAELDEILKGTSGNDVINGGAGDDYPGKAGNDILDGAQGNDQLQGMRAIRLSPAAHGNDMVDGGGGIDTAVYSGSDQGHTALSCEGGKAPFATPAGPRSTATTGCITCRAADVRRRIIDLTQNNAPIAFDDSASTNEDVGTYCSGSASVLDNDFDWEHRHADVTNAGHHNGIYGTLTLNANGTYSYTPNAYDPGAGPGPDRARTASTTRSPTAA